MKNINLLFGQQLFRRKPIVEKKTISYKLFHFKQNVVLFFSLHKKLNAKFLFRRFPHGHVDEKSIISCWADVTLPLQIQVFIIFEMFYKDFLFMLM